MKQEKQNGKSLFQHISKIFGDSASSSDKQEIKTPRVTCTRLKRFRETRQDIVVELECNTVNKLTRTDDAPLENADGEEMSEEARAEEARNRASFANWVERTQKMHHEKLEKQQKFHEECKNIQEKEANKTVQGFAHFSSAALVELAKNPNTPMVTLKWLAAHDHVEVRRALATNENIGSVILHILVRDGDDGVKEAILDNKCITKEEIFRLCDEENPHIAEKAKNKLEPSMRPKINRRLAKAVTENIDLKTAKSIRHSWG
jgi:hypothetical protein